MKQSTKLCECGCGAPAPISPVTDKYHGWIKGEAKRFISGHNSAARVLSERDYTVDQSGCWIWKGGTTPLGYGFVRIRGKRVYAHRAMWELSHGEIPDGLELDHLCRVPSCVRPDHLQPVTHAENLRRGKGVRVTPKVFAEVFRLRAVGLSHREIAKKVGIGKTTVGYILNGQRWTQLHD